MQIKGNLMNQIWENSKKYNFGPDFGQFYPKFGPQNFFFVGFTSTKYYTLLQATIVCNVKEN